MVYINAWAASQDKKANVCSCSGIIVDLWWSCWWRWRRMLSGIRGRRKSGYGHTAVQRIIIGLVRQHLLWQHSSHQPRGEFRDRHKDRQTQTGADTGRQNLASSYDSFQFTVRFNGSWSLRSTSSNPCLPCSGVLDRFSGLTMTSDLPWVYTSSEHTVMYVCCICMRLNDYPHQKHP